MSLEKIENIIIESLKEYNQALENIELKTYSKQTKLYGEKSVLDSIGLVYLITDIEEKISDKFSKNIVLADEKAMSQKTSPFRDIETLAKYILNLLKD